VHSGRHFSRTFPRQFRHPRCTTCPHYVYDGRSISNENQCIRLKNIYNLYISKTYIVYRHRWVCCGCDVILIYDVVGRYMETICSVNANSLESYSVMRSGHHKDVISDFKTEGVTGWGVRSLLCAWWSYCMKPESRTVCWVIIDLWTGLQCRIYGKARGVRSLAPAHQGL